MGLEKLKSVFSEEAGVNNSRISGRYDEDKRVEPMEDIFRNRTSAVDFFGGNNSYKSTLDPSVSGFTKNFNLGGYAFGNGQLGNSRYLEVLSDAQTRTNIVDVSNLTTNQLGFGEYKTPEFDDDIRFTVGLGWPFANTILQVSKEGNAASLYYTTTDGKISVGASGAFSNFGPISNLAQKIGISVPPLDFSVDILSSKPLKYGDTIWEKNNNITPQDIGSDLPPGYLGNQRGNAFQVITPNVNYGMAIERSAPGLGPISTMEDLYEGTKGGHGAERGVTAQEVINFNNTGLHLYLGNQTSFVKLGPDIYQGSILDALRAGDIGYIKDKATEFALGVGEKILDKTPDILATAGKNISDWASGFKVETELPDLTTLVGQFSLKGLKGPSTDFPSFSSMGGFFDGVKLPNLSLPFSMPDINLPDINLPQIPSLPSIPGLGGGRGSGLFSGFSVNVPPFPKISIKNNPDLLDLFESIKNDTIGLVKAEAGFKQGLLGDNAGADGSFTNNVNPRSLTPKPSIWNNPQLPYKQLGTKYTDGIESKHPTESEDFDDPPKVSTDFYPSTFNRGLPDLKTMLPANAGNTLKEAGESYDSETYVQVAQGEKYGLPFYFKDLRDNKYIIFRGYLSGIGQQVSPEWTPHSYLGRSEEVHVYSKAKRDINFTFKVYATTKPELQLIYEKLNQLTSMAYPQYREDIPSLKNRMKPPMCSLRIGELFGNDSIQGVTGFLNSLNFNWPDNSTWEIEHGKRVPKECDVTVGFTVVHKKPPHHSSPSSEFFGLGFK